MSENKTWDFVKRFKTVLEIIATLIVLIPVLYAIAKDGLSATLPAWTILLFSLATLILGFLLGKKALSSQKIASKDASSDTLVEKITFTYKDTPANHDWEISECSPENQPSFENFSDGFFGDVIKIKSNAVYAMDYRVKPLSQLGTKIEYAVQTDYNSRIYALVGIQSQNEKKTKIGWIKIKIGNKKPHPLGTGAGEWSVYITPKVIHGDWQLFQVNLEEIVNSSFGTNGWKLQSFKGVRFRGDLSVAYISILKAG